MNHPRNVQLTSIFFLVEPFFFANFGSAACREKIFHILYIIALTIRSKMDKYYYEQFINNIKIKLNYLTVKEKKYLFASIKTTIVVLSFCYILRVSITINFFDA